MDLPPQVSASLCPQCRGEGIPFRVTAGRDHLIVSRRCGTCRHEWDRVDDTGPAWFSRPKTHVVPPVDEGS